MSPFSLPKAGCNCVALAAGSQQPGLEMGPTKTRRPGGTGLRSEDWDWDQTTQLSSVKTLWPRSPKRRSTHRFRD